MWWANPGWWGSPVHAAWAGGGGGSNPFSLIAHTLAITSSNNSVSTSAIDTTGANLIVINVQVLEASAGGGTGVFDSKTNTWTALTAHKVTGDPYQQIWYCVSPTVGTGHIFDYSGGGTLFGGISVQAWSGANATQGVIVENGATASSAVSLATGSVTPGASNSLIVAGLCTSPGATALSFDAAWTITDKIDGALGTNLGGAMAYLKQGAAAAVNPTWSWTGSNNAGAGIAVFKS